MVFFLLSLFTPPPPLCVFLFAGAYIFRPNSSTPLAINTGNVEVTVQKTAAEIIVSQTWSSWLSTETRLHPNSDVVDVAYQVGPIPFEDGLGKEIFVRYSTDIASSELFFTDSNGRELQRRQLNFRPTWKWNDTEPVAGNCALFVLGKRRCCVAVRWRHA